MSLPPLLEEIHQPARIFRASCEGCPQFGVKDHTEEVQRTIVAHKNLYYYLGKKTLQRHTQK